MYLFYVMFFFVFIFDLSNCSLGDRTYTFNRCVGFCRSKFCNDDKFLSDTNLPQSILRVKKTNWRYRLEFLVLWKCPNECKYICMWKTVAAFKNDGLDVPQFYGKWPLIRLFGVEEISSAVAAFGNLVVSTLVFTRFWKGVPADSPCYYLWWLHYLTGCAAWTSASIFHIADTWTTEKLDYFSALLFAICASYVAIIRIFALTRQNIKILTAILCFAYFLCHISFMLFRRFDYAYNMIAFIVIGTFNVVCWSLWAVKNRKLEQSKYIITWAMWLAIFSILEMKEFTPIFWLFDAHSIWHWGTIFITIPLYKFATLDCLYLRTLKMKSE